MCPGRQTEQESDTRPYDNEDSSYTRLCQPDCGQQIEGSDYSL